MSAGGYIPGPDTRLSFTIWPESFDDLNGFLQRAGSLVRVEDTEDTEIEWDEWGGGGGPVFYTDDRQTILNYQPEVYCLTDWSFGQWLDAARESARRAKNPALVEVASIAETENCCGKCGSWTESFLVHLTRSQRIHLCLDCIAEDPRIIELPEAESWEG